LWGTLRLPLHNSPYIQSGVTPQFNPFNLFALLEESYVQTILILALVFAGCQNPNAPAGGAAPAGGDQAAAPATTVSEFHPAWPYSPPPTGHYNTFVTDGFAMGIYQQLMEPSLFMYKWVDATWIPIAGQSWER
jgi:hypothetical protein